MLVANALSCHTQGVVEVALQLAAASWLTVSPPAVIAAVLGMPFAPAGISSRPMYSCEPPLGVPVPLPLPTHRFPLGSTNRPFELYSPRPVTSSTGAVVVAAGAVYGISYRL